MPQREERPLPETELERAICADPDWQEGMSWGRPRPGHPEGSVGRHTVEVLTNVERFAHGEAERCDLRLVALLHDCCKHQTTRGGPSHGALARYLAEHYLDDERLLTVVERHDAGFRAWRLLKRGQEHRAEETLAELLASLREHDAVGLFLSFVRCDSLTGDKSPLTYQWLTARFGQGDG